VRLREEGSMKRRTVRHALPVAALLLGGAGVSCTSDGADLPVTAADSAPVQVLSESDPRMTLYTDTLPSCPSCEVHLDPIAVLGHVEDPVLLRDFPIVVRDGRGRFHATVRNARDHEVIVYDTDGSVLRTIGRGGDGPGEFRSVADLYIDANDTLYLAHADDGRVSLFDSAGVFQRSFRLDPMPTPPYNRIVGLWNGGLLLNAYYSPSRLSVSSDPLHRFSPDGERVRAFGPDDLLDEYSAEQGRRASPFRISALGSDQSIWLALGNDYGGHRYRFERLDAAGELRQVVGVLAPPSWNQLRMAMTREEAEQDQREDPPRARPASHDPTPALLTSKPYARVCCMAPLEPGLLLVANWVAAPDWSDVEITWSPLRLGEKRQQRTPDVDLRLTHTVLDVISVESGEVLARLRRPGVATLTRDGTLLDRAVSPEGILQLHAYAVSFVR
jgi:hypothetical protein